MTEKIESRYDKYLTRKEELIERENEFKEKRRHAKNLVERRRFNLKINSIRKEILAQTKKIRELRNQYDIPKTDDILD